MTWSLDEVEDNNLSLNSRGGIGNGLLKLFDWQV